MIQDIADTYKALSDPTRLRILKLLATYKKLCVNAITAKLNVTQSAVSQHLRVLRQAGLVNHERMQTHVHYSLTENALQAFHTRAAAELGSDPT